MSFEKIDNFNNLSNNLNNNLRKEKRTNLFFLIFLTVASSVAIIFVPFLSFVALAFFPVCATLLLNLNKIRDFIICSISGIIIFLLFNYVVAIVFLIIIVSIAFAYKYLLSKKLKVFHILIAVLLVFLISVFLFFIIDSAFTKQNALIETKNAYNKFVDDIDKDPIIKNYKNLLPIENNQYEQIINLTKSFLKFLPKILPGILIVNFSLISILNYYFSYVFLNRYSIEIKPFKPFKEWDLPWYWCWGIIIGIILIIITSFNPGYNNIILIVGYNLLIIFGFVYLILGISVIWGFFDRFNIKNFIKVIIIIVVFIIFGLVIFLPVIGLIDIWVNFRRLKRVH